MDFVWVKLLLTQLTFFFFLLFFFSLGGGWGVSPFI